MGIAASAESGTVRVAHLLGGHHLPRRLSRIGLRRRRGQMSGIRMDDEPQPGEIRFNDNDDIEVFDGAIWSVYRALSSDDIGNPLRNDPDAERVARDADGSR